MKSWIWPVMSRMSMKMQLALVAMQHDAAGGAHLGPVISPGPCSASHLRKSKSALGRSEIG